MADIYSLKDKLHGKYRNTYDTIELYANAKGIDEDAGEEMLMNVLDLLMTAQQEEKPVEQ